ncbi:MAG TPA: hypothetical protein VNW15_07475 [Rhizomicrobium sp.]|nr:hypothetical protein [Rhizomicrobium sp.]
MTLIRFLKMSFISGPLMLLSGQTAAATGDGRYLIWGGGQSSCGTWSEAKSTNAFLYTSAKQWLEGYVSAYNRYSWQGKNVASETNGNGMFSWVDDYCAANPTKDISDAANALVIFLSSGPHPNDK